ncbi:uncharacterized protein LOC110944588 [Helianthus annuus]|uniref:uncharacterized protein LOC110944588 n=1 Tax=Helianthus annuus TaxID=4232 RepID=UPI000B8FED0D|nr:uncharacterized protein LOC110944588 [Helianthus annuus]
MYKKLVQKNISKKKKFVASSNVRGSIDTMFKTDHGKTKQTTMDRNNPIKGKLKTEAWDKFATWAYSIGLPFNVVRDEGFQDMINAIGEYGRGMPAPSYHNIHVSLMKQKLEETKEFVDSFRPHWEECRCSIMSDFWTDGKGRCLINFLVNFPFGTFITDNGSNFKAAGKILQEEHPRMFWTPCAAQCVNLMIQDIGEKIPKIKTTLADARAMVVFIYIHGRFLNLMRKLTRNKELHRLVDTEEKPSMGYIYDAMVRVKEQIKKNVTDERLVHKILVGYYLNPAILHGENSKDKKKNAEILTRLYVAIDCLVPNIEENDKVRQDLNLYIDSVGQFGSTATIRGRTKVAPYIWWRTYGIDTPLLQTFTISVLSQTCSASPCERNWSTFDNVTKVLQLIKANRSLDPILLRDVEENDDWVTPTQDELQEFVGGTDGLRWSDVQEAMGGNEEVRPGTRTKRSRYRDDDDDVRIHVEDDLNVQLDEMVDVDPEEDFMAYD